MRMESGGLQEIRERKSKLFPDPDPGQLSQTNF